MTTIQIRAYKLNDEQKVGVWVDHLFVEQFDCDQKFDKAQAIAFAKSKYRKIYKGCRMDFIKTGKN